MGALSAHLECTICQSTSRKSVVEVAKTGTARIWIYRHKFC